MRAALQMILRLVLVASGAYVLEEVTMVSRVVRTAIVQEDHVVAFLERVSLCLGNVWGVL